MSFPNSPIESNGYLVIKDLLRLRIGEEVQGLITGVSWEKFLDIKESIAKELLLEFLSTFNCHKLNINYDREDTIQFRLGGIPHSMSINKFRVNCGFYEEELLDDDRYLMSSF